MAKQKFDREDDVVINDAEKKAPVEAAETAAAETPAEQPAPKAEKTETAKAKVNDGVRMMKIRTTEPVNATVAGTRYEFQKGKEVSVPSDVAAILCNAKKAFRM